MEKVLPAVQLSWLVLLSCCWWGCQIVHIWQQKCCYRSYSERPLRGDDIVCKRGNWPDKVILNNILNILLLWIPGYLFVLQYEWWQQHLCLALILTLGRSRLWMTESEEDHVPKQELYQHVNFCCCCKTQCRCRRWGKIERMRSGRVNRAPVCESAHPLPPPVPWLSGIWHKC